MSIESRIRQYGRVFNEWQVQETLRQSPDGKYASFRLSHSTSGQISCGLRVISLMEEQGDFAALSDEQKASYHKRYTYATQTASDQIQKMKHSQENPNLVCDLEHRFLNWSNPTGYGCDLLIRCELLPDLRQVLDSGRVLSEKDIIQLAKDICSALVTAHSSQVHHHSICPETIFVCDAVGSYKLAFGDLAEVNRYSAPETKLGQRDHRSDIYSLGLVLYALCNNGQLPSDSAATGAYLPRPCNISDAFSGIVLTACAYSPEHRYQSAQEMLNDLYLIAPAPAVVAAQNAAGKQKTKKRRWPAVLILLIILAALAAFAYACRTYFLEDEPEKRSSSTQKQEPEEPTGSTQSAPSAAPTGSAAATEPATAPAVTEPAATEPAATEPAETIPSVYNPLADLEVGDTFTFGTWEQDNNGRNGAEPIDWVVLDKLGDEILVISKYGLSARAYRSSLTATTWETSDARIWLNDVFYTSAFNAEEMSRICLKDISPDGNPQYNTYVGASTQDHIFLLSIGETEHYLPYSTDRLCYATPNTALEGAYQNPNTGASWWLLRTPGSIASYVTSVNSDGTIDYDGGKVDSNKGVMRPAMWISVE